MMGRCCHGFSRNFFWTAFSSAAMALTTPQPYTPPSFCDGFLTNPPKFGRLVLANLPTPLYQIVVAQPNTNEGANGRPKNSIFQDLNNAGASLFIKRDDATHGVELGGNKIRKLEFLLAEAVSTKCTAVVTIGGMQSNHCRATAAASRMVGLEPHLILRTRAPESEADAMIGNVLIDRLVGSHIYTCTPGEYGRLGSQELVRRVCAHLQQEEHGGVDAYAIPVGGSNGLGTWGYIEAVKELIQQWEDQYQVGSRPDHIVFACGSGGTAAGIFLGMTLAHHVLSKPPGEDSIKMPTLHAIGVCDDPDYFYNAIADIATQMGLRLPEKSPFATTEDFVREYMVVHNGKGKGYAQSTQDELDFISDFATSTGIALDPVYSGKALYNFWQTVVRSQANQIDNQRILFWHTGGALGLYDKVDALTTQTSVLQTSPCARLDVYGKGGGVDVPEGL